MRGKWIVLQLTAATLALAVGSAYLAAAQQAPEGKTTEQAFANIKVLQGMPADQLLPTMAGFSAALGIGCPYCHTPPNFSGDEKQPKQTARQMVTMVQMLNKDNFGGRPEVTCYTCHHGSVIPASAAGGAGAAALAARPVVLPSADQIVAKYLEALGGEEALRKITTRHISASREVPGQLSAPFERYEKAPNLSVTLMKAPVGIVGNGFDGKTAWTEMGPNQVSENSGIDLARAKRDSDFYRDVDLKKEYPALTVRGMEKVGARNAYRVDGFAEDGSGVRLFFDTQSGLLLRVVSSAWLAPGDTPNTIEFDDYRDVNGIKFPFVVRDSGSKPSERTETRVDKVEFNTPIENGKFAMPAAQPESWAKIPAR